MNVEHADNYNTKCELERLKFDKNYGHESPVETFERLISKLACFDEPISLEPKASMLLRTLPTRLTSTIRIFETSEVYFAKGVVISKVEIYRRSCLRNQKIQHTLPLLSTKSTLNTKRTNKTD